MSKKKEHQEPVTPETEADIAAGTDVVEASADEMVVQLRGELAACQEALVKAQHDLLRAHADYDNFRKRLRAERDQEFGRGSDRVLNDLLPVLDDFQRALAAVNDTSTVESLHQGVALICRQLQALLERYGLTPMEVVGKPFDPKYHDAVASVTTTDMPDHSVLAEMQRGYLKNGDVFRPAKVAVAMAPDES